MTTLYNKLHIFGQTMLLVFFTLSVLSLGRKQRDVGDYYATKTDALMSAAMSRELAHVFDGDDSLRDQALFLVQYKKFINYVNMVPGFLYWHEFDELDERLAKQIQVLKAKYK